MAKKTKKKAKNPKPIIDTPRRVRIIHEVEKYQEKGVSFHYNDVFRDHGVSKATGWRILKEKRDRSTKPSKRGLKRKLTDEHVDILEAFIENNGFDSRSLHYGQLLSAVGLDVDVSEDTVRRRLNERGFSRCLACHKHWVSLRLKERRQEFARTMLERYPKVEDWYNVRFSDETHFSWGPQGRIRLLRKPHDRYTTHCIVEDRERPEEGYKRLHAWAAVGYNFKSPLVWYNVEGNKNGKMSLEAYRDQILDPIVGQWLRDGDDFTLEEDNDSGHGTGKANIVRTWKRHNGLNSYFNCAQSPDLAPIERAWAWPKRKVRSQEVWDDESLQTLAEEGWADLKQETINEWINRIPELLKQVADPDELAGRMSGF